MVVFCEIISKVAPQKNTNGAINNGNKAKNDSKVSSKCDQKSEISNGLGICPANEI